MKHFLNGSLVKSSKQNVLARHLHIIEMCFLKRRNKICFPNLIISQEIETLWLYLLICLPQGKQTQIKVTYSNCLIVSTDFLDHIRSINFSFCLLQWHCLKLRFSYDYLELSQLTPVSLWRISMIVCLCVCVCVRAHINWKTWAVNFLTF